MIRTHLHPSASAPSPDLDDTIPEPFSKGWTIRSSTLGELFVEIEMILWKLLLEPDVYVIFKLEGNRFVQAFMNREGRGLWCETVADRFLGHDCTGPRYNVDQLASLVRNRWMSPQVDSDETPNWYRALPLDTMGLPALASQLLVSTLIDFHGLRHPDELTVIVGPW